MSLENIKNTFLPKYKCYGSYKFNKYLVFSAIQTVVLIDKEQYSGPFPHIYYIECYENCVILYRREGLQEYLSLAKDFRKVAHQIYRLMLKKNMTNSNSKFLNLV